MNPLAQLFITLLTVLCIVQARFLNGVQSFVSSFDSIIK